MWRLQRYVQEHNGISGFPGAEAIAREGLLELECDILVPAALGGQLTAANAGRIKARMIAEGANGPTVPAADAVFSERGILVIPDILCSAGGVIVSYFEWVQGMQRLFWSEAEVSERLEAILVNSFHQVMAGAEQAGDLRNAALDLAIGRLAEALSVRGLYP